MSLERIAALMSGGLPDLGPLSIGIERACGGRRGVRYLLPLDMGRMGWFVTGSP